MKMFHKIWPILLLLLVWGCSETSDIEKPAKPVKPTTQTNFIKTDDPKKFFAAYMDDLSGESYFPAELMEMLGGRTALTAANDLIVQHATVPFVEWYFSEAHLKRIGKVVKKKVDRMDYQLKVLEVSRKTAETVLLMTDVGIIDHKKIFRHENLAEAWSQQDENTYLLELSAGGWAMPLKVVREKGQWKIENAVY